MSDKLQHIDIDSEEFEDAPRALREYAKQLKKQNESLASENGTLKKQSASRAVADVLAGKGFKNPKRVERDLLADDIDPHDSKSVEEWLEANGDDYAKDSATPEAAAPETPDPRAAEYERLNIGGGDASVAASFASKWEAVQAEITPDMDGAAVLEVYARHGI
ncbi:MAG TPA: hypothetical protein VFH56_00650 [Acidimicrobiales bacterium]|nr:hypothetical protein [Acidimicrobiales bacterium]